MDEAVVLITDDSNLDGHSGFFNILCVVQR